MEKKLAHLEMIQAVITRMAGNSFALKGWAVTLVAGLFALSGKDANQFYYLVTYIPIVVFWYLDAYYLCQERMYRNLYEKVRKLGEDEIDFSMNAAAREFQTDKTTVANCFLSKTILGFYLPLAVVTAGIIIITAII